jgi:hypothetical protein
MEDAHVDKMREHFEPAPPGSKVKPGNPGY